jgi:hypothetical protein
VSWKGGKIYQFDFAEADSILGITSDDIRQHGHNAGAICRARIQQIWMNNGCPVTRPTALNEAKVAALTPRGARQNSSVRTRTQLPSPRTELSLTPMPSPRTERSSSARSNVYNHELTSSPLVSEMDIYILVFMLLDEKLLTFMRDAHNLTGLEKQGHIWFLYDLLSWFGRFYGRGNVLFNPRLQRTFFQTMFESKLVKEALRIFLKEDPGYNSLEILTKSSAEKQQEFLDTLKMVVMHELWIVQSEGKVVMPFVYKTPQGVWKQDPETFVFSLVPLSQIVQAA